MEFVRDEEPVDLPTHRGAGVSAALIGAMESMAVGESGVVEAKLETVRSLVSRHMRTQRELAEGLLANAPAALIAVAYTKRFVVRRTEKAGKVRVWRVA